jgi:hypothetical protein
MPQPGFLENLRRSRLLSDKQLAALSSLASTSDQAALADALIKRGWMTPFQVRQVAEGNTDYLRLGEYILLDKIGEGAMGDVFRASHLRFGIVALKVMKRSKLTNPAAVKRFFKEIELAARLNHPNIVRARDSGAAGDSYYLAMEFVDGVDLSRLVKEKGPLGIEQACHYIRQAALALHHAHENGIVHRDIKPGNLMIDSSGQVKLLDLGLARMEAFEESNALTRMGQMIGTPDYLAPEQAIDARRADARADLYSLGCTLFYLVAGKPPFSAASLPDLLLKHQSELARPLRSFRPDAPAWLVQLCGWMMNKRPEDRPASALEVVQRLDPFLAGFQPPPPPETGNANPWEGVGGSGRLVGPTRPGPRPPAWGWVRYAVIAALLLGAVVAAAALLAPGRPGKGGGSPDSRKKASAEDGGKKDGPGESPPKDGGKDKGAGPAGKDQGKPPAPSRPKAEKKGFGYLFPKSHGKAAVTRAAASADGKWAATAAGWQVVLWNLAAAAPEEAWKLEAPGNGGVQELSFPAGQPVLRVRLANQVMSVNLADGSSAGPPTDAAVKAPDVAGLDFYDDKAALVIENRALRVLGLEGQKDKPLPFDPSRAAYLPDGSAAIGSTTGDLLILSEESAYTLQNLPFKEAITCLAASTDGKWLFAGTDKQSRLINLAALGEEKQNFPSAPRVGASAAAFVPGGRLLVGSRDGTVRLFNLPKSK